MDFTIGIIVIAVAFALIIVAGVLVYKTLETKEKKDSIASLPKGADTTEVGKMLQEKYTAERNSDVDFNQEFFGDK